MQSGQPSRTALGAATHRAVHQLLDRGFIFSDPIAVRILGIDPGSIDREAESEPARRRLRMFIAVRARFAEDALTNAVARGVGQLVVLGAGLDTYAYRGSFGERLRIFEVDHPATQAWKRGRLIEAAIPVPDALTFVPADLERESLAEVLGGAGFDMRQPAFFTWLGVAPYLSEDAVLATLGFIAGRPEGSEVVFDYRNPPDQEQAAARQALAARVASIGEPFKSEFETAAFHTKLTEMGFREIEDLGPRAIRERYFPNRANESRDRGGHIIRVRR
jgi:methyltransferase (TIGR00027 family)